MNPEIPLAPLDLDALEAKVEQIITQCRVLRDENALLRQQAARLAADKNELAEKIAQAKARLETLMQKLPEDA